MSVKLLLQYCSMGKPFGAFRYVYWHRGLCDHPWGDILLKVVGSIIACPSRRLTNKLPFHNLWANTIISIGHIYDSVLSRILNVNTTQRSPFVQDKLNINMAKDSKVLISLKGQEEGIDWSGKRPPSSHNTLKAMQFGVWVIKSVHVKKLTALKTGLV